MQLNFHIVPIQFTRTCGSFHLTLLCRLLITFSKNNSEQHNKVRWKNERWQRQGQKQCNECQDSLRFEARRMSHLFWRSKAQPHQQMHPVVRPDDLRRLSLLDSRGRMLQYGSGLLLFSINLWVSLCVVNARFRLVRVIFGFGSLATDVSHGSWWWLMSCSSHQRFI